VLDWLNGIWHAVTNFGQLVAYGLVSVVNALIAALGAFIAAVIGLFPTLPAAPGPPSSGVLQWVNYFLPLGGMLALFGTFVTLWISFLGIRVALKWAKAL
jgi:uncharacterized membrane protein